MESRRLFCVISASCFLLSSLAGMGLANEELDTLNQQIAKCYSDGKLEAAKPLYEKALKIIEASGNQDALAEAQKNFQLLLKRIEAKTGSANARPAAVPSAVSLSPSSAGKEACAKYVTEVGRRCNEMWFKEDASFRAPIMVQFLVNAQGAISQLQLAPGCGATELEKFDAFGAIMKAAPFGPLPKAALPSLSVRITLKQDRGSIGIVFGVSRDNNIIITHVRPGSPAEKAGVAAGDLILSVDGEEIPSIPSLTEVSHMMHGKTGTTINLEIQHEGQVKAVNITRIEAQQLTQDALKAIDKANKVAAQAPSVMKVSSQNKNEARKLASQARNLADSGDLKKSIELLDKAAQLDSSNPEIWFDRGVVNRELKNWPVAIADFEQGQQLAPTLELIRVELARCYAGAGQRDKAIQMLWQLRDRRDAEHVASKIDGVLVELADPKALASLTMLSHARPIQLVKAKSYLSADSKNSRQIGNLDRLISERRPTDKEEAELARYYVSEKEWRSALTCFERLYEVDRMEPDYLYALIQCHKELGNLELCHQRMEEYCTRFPTDFRSGGIRERVAYYKKDFQDIREGEKTKTARQQDEAHFLKRQMPLKVYIPSVIHETMSWAKRPDPSIDFSGIVRKVLEDWKRETKGKVSFEVVNDLNDSLIEVEWIGSSSNMHHSFAAGSAGFVDKPGRGRKMEVRLMLIRESGDELTADQFYQTTLHEFGHVLGLSHSSQPKDIMYWSGVSSRASSLSENDIRRAESLYE